MSQIELRVLKQGLQSPRVFSASFFTMKDAYRKFEVYEGNLKHFCRITNHSGFCTRIYTDDSGQDIALRVAEKYDHVSVIHFNCELFREDVGHVGTFGTIVRFLPLFEDGLERVWVSDIDIPEVYISPNHLRAMDQAKADLYFRTYLCYDTKVYGRHFTITAGTIISKIVFPRQILTKFLNKLADGGLNDTIDLLNRDNAIRKKVSSKIPYGIDEVFTNTTFYEWLIRHKVRCLVLKDYTSAAWHLQSKGILPDNEKRLFEMYYSSNNKNLIPRMKAILLKKLPPYIEEKPCLKEMLDILPNIKNSMYVPYVVVGQELD